MKIYIKYMPVFIFCMVMGEFSKANKYCACISGSSFPEGSGLRYIARCYDAKGNVIETLENTTISSKSEAQQKTNAFMGMYNIKKDDCVEYPDGKMILDLSKR